MRCSDQSKSIFEQRSNKTPCMLTIVNLSLATFGNVQFDVFTFIKYHYKYIIDIAVIPIFILFSQFPQYIKQWF